MEALRAVPFFLAAAVLLPGPVLAQDEPAPQATTAKPEKWGGRGLDHKMQGSVDLLVGTAFFLVAPYDKDDPDRMCGPDKSTHDTSDGAAVCTGLSAWHVDVSGGFAPLPGFEVFAIARLGLGSSDRYTPNTRQLGLGIKGYTPSESLFKLSVGIAPLFDFSQRRSEEKDFGIFVPLAAHFDFLPWLGSYIQTAPIFSFVSEFRLELSVGLGVQGRFP
ncbi:MAG: hypothetical protein MUC50_22260 [Myxococcota bacterium]|jgi:hypothetical protein|nr:hypothetical protein [Myxococcota bacterium]